MLKIAKLAIKQEKRASMTRSGRGRGRRLRVQCLVLAVGLTLSAGGQAQWIVNDPPHTIESTLNEMQNLSGWTEQATHYAAEVQQWASVIAYWEAMLIKLKSQLGSLTSQLPSGVTLEKVDDYYLVDDKCGDSDIEFSVSGLMEVLTTAVTADMGPQDIKDEQTEVCSYIQILKNQKYNELLEFSETTVAELNADLQTIDTRRDSSTDPGVMSASMYDAITMLNKQQIIAKQWQARMSAYDTYIGIMENKQNMLAAKAMRGQESLFGTVVKNLALKAALETD